MQSEGHLQKRPITVAVLGKRIPTSLLYICQYKHIVLSHCFQLVNKLLIPCLGGAIEITRKAIICVREALENCSEDDLTVSP